MKQQEERGSVRLVVVDPDLNAQCERVAKHVLEPMAAAIGEGPDRALFADGIAAFRAVRDILAEAVATGRRVWTPNGRWEHEGLRVVSLPAAHTDLLYAVLRTLSGALAAPPDPAAAATAAALRTVAAPEPAESDSAGPGSGDPSSGDPDSTAPDSVALGSAAPGSGDSRSEESAVALVGALARVLSMVDLTPDADTATLSTALQAADSENVRLTYPQEEAWQRLAHRVTVLLTESEPLHRFLY
ncbi:hypothetical protein [Streptomyces sp. NPDC059009]|uniref:hypothetical protein n=1 Tax=Streptomyces sp. NPDC059009 TaxID=3346694 RepID=UPI003688717B